MRRTRQSIFKSLALGAPTALLFTATASAQTTIDVARISCEQFTLMKVAPPDYLAVWLSGYYHGKQNDPVVDVDGLKANIQKIKTYCLYNKGTLMEAIENTLRTSH
jgi:hypothetical protein